MFKKVYFVRTSENAKPPAYAHDGDKGADLYSIENVIISPGDRATINTGIRLGLPPGHAGFVVSRSGLASKHGISVLNSPGLIDTFYHGDIKVILHNSNHMPYTIEIGDRIAQLVIVQLNDFNFEDIVSSDTFETLFKSDRGVKGFGSSGK